MSVDIKHGGMNMDGIYDIVVQIKTSPKIIDKFTIEAPSEMRAEGDAKTEAIKKWKRLGYKSEELEIRVLDPKELEPPPKDPTDKSKAGETVENVLEWFSGSTDVAGTIAEIKKVEKIIARFEDLEKAAKKLNIAGYVFTGIDIVTDFAVLCGYYYEFKKSEPGSRKREALQNEMALCYFSMTKTLIMSVIPGGGVIDLGLKAIAALVMAIMQAKADEKLVTEKYLYEKEENSLSEGDFYHEIEWRMFTARISMDDILAIRRDFFEGTWPGVTFHPDYSTGVSVGNIKDKDGPTKNITVTFDANGGKSPTPPSKRATPGHAYFKLATASRDYRTFVGWYDAPEGGTKVEPTDIVTDSKAKDHTLYAHWAIGDGPILAYFDAQGGTPEPAPFYLAINKKFEYGCPIVEKNGYTFGGWWYMSSSGKEVKFLNESYIHLNISTTTFTIYAKWTIRNVKVMFDSVGGTAPNPASREITFDTAYGTLPNVSNRGYKFDGWFTEAIGGTEIKPTDKVANGKDHTLYAHWAITVTVEFNSNGGTPNPAKKEVTVTVMAQGGTPNPFLLRTDLGYLGKFDDCPTVKKEGYTFGGWWYKAPSGKEGEFQPPCLIDLKSSTATFTVYAKWTKNVTVKFDSNGGGTPSFTTKEYSPGSAYGSFPTVDRDGYDFDGWFTEAKDGTPISEKDIVGHKVLYAHWAEEKASGITVTFDADGGTPVPSPRNRTFDSEYGKLPSVYKPNYNFVGWFNLPEGGKTVDANTKLVDRYDHTLYARWSPAGGMLVTFEPNGGDTPDPPTKNFSPGYKYGELPNCNRSGYSLDGWFTEAKGGTKVNGKDVFTASYNTLYAHWTSTSAITVSFDAAGGTPIPYDKGIHTPGSPYGKLPTVTRDGYSFDGWYNAAEGGTKIEESDIATYNIKLYAHWIDDTSKPTPTPDLKSITISFDTNGGTPKPAPRVVPIGSDYGRLPTVAKAGCKFLGWANDLGDVNETTKTFATSHTLYAIWDK